MAAREQNGVQKLICIAIDRTVEALARLTGGQPQVRSLRSKRFHMNDGFSCDSHLNISIIKFCRYYMDPRQNTAWTLYCFLMYTVYIG